MRWWVWLERFAGRVDEADLFFETKREVRNVAQHAVRGFVQLADLAIHALGGRAGRVDGVLKRIVERRDLLRDLALDRAERGGGGVDRRLQQAVGLAEFRDDVANLDAQRFVRAGDVVDALDEVLCDAVGELVEVTLDLVRSAEQVIVGGAHALDQQVGRSEALLLDRIRDALQPADDQFLELVDARIQRLGHLQGPGAQRLVDLGCALGKRCGHLRGLRGEVFAHAGDALLDRLGGALRTLGNGLREFERTGGKRFVQRLRARVERGLDAIDALVEVFRDFANLGRDPLIERREAVARGFRNPGDSGFHLVDDAAAVTPHGGFEGLHALRHGLVERAGIRGDAVRDVVAARGDGVGKGTQLLADSVLEGLAALGDHPRNFVGALAEPHMHVVCRLLQRFGYLVVAVGDGFRDLDADFGQALGRFRAPLGQAVEDGIAGIHELGAGVFGAHQDVFRDAAGRAVECARDAVGDVLHVEGESFVGMRDRVAQMRGVFDDRVTFVVEFADQCTHAVFVLVVGALERRDFAPHHGLEFGCARDGAFDAVAERRDFAADGLADRNDGVGGDAFGLGEAQRDFRHRARDMAHFLRAANKHRRHDEEEGRQQDCGERRQEARLRGDFGNRHRAGSSPVLRTRDQRAADDPSHRAEQRCKNRRARRLLVKRLQNLADRLAVVVRGGTRQPFARAAGALREDFARGLGRAGLVAARGVALGRRRRHFRNVLADVQRVLDCGKRCFGRVLGLLVLHDCLRSVLDTATGKMPFGPENTQRTVTLYWYRGGNFLLTEETPAARDSGPPLGVSYRAGV